MIGVDRRSHPSPASAGTTREPARIFLLSPATLGGVRGRRILDGEAGADFMDRLRAGRAVPLGDVYAFISSLYYRGKRTYAHRFGRPAGDGPAVLAITPSLGLLPDEQPVRMSDLRSFAETDIDPESRAYREALYASALALARALPGSAELILLGSIASGKYLDPLSVVFGRRLLVPASFVGRGDMSRGGLLLRAAAAGRELEYVVALDAERRGPRPPKLGPPGQEG